MKRLSKNQKRALWVGFVIFMIINIFPPWAAVTNPPDYLIKESIGYSLIISPPQSPLGYESYVVINYTRLFIQWGIVVFLTIVALILFRKSK